MFVYILIFIGSIILPTGKLLYLIVGPVVGGIVLLAILAIIGVTVAMCVKSYRRKLRLRHVGTGQCMHEYPYSTVVQ